jgi:protease-4
LIVIFVINLIYYSNKVVPNVALVEISGVINQANTDKWIKQLKQVKKNIRYKGLIIKINSPGGLANASERLYDAIREVGKKKPVVALVEDVCASGAYYAACGAKTIVAYPTSIIGSIGVIFEVLNVSSLSKKVGISSFVVKSGKVKDAGNPFRKPNKDDINMLQRAVDGIYFEFLSAVSKSRNIKIDKLRKYADGSVFAAKDALKIGLIDGLGGYESAKNELKKQAGIKTVSIEKLKEKKKILQEIFGSRVYFLFDYLNLLLKPSIKAILYD